ncbi:MAG TPA: single-stranded DNA-binding protein [Actinomycetes bacterium]|nr:single-stranded DNA-binding protein [Actinomycetes bacterium]
MSDNQVTLSGNLTDDPELRFTPNGVAVANFRLAVDQRVWDTDGWKDGESSYFRVSVWRDQAEHVSRSLHKGARCVVVGRLRSRSWETPEGQRRSAVEVDAEEVGMSLRFGAAASAPAPVTPAPPPAEAATERPAPAKAGGNGSRRGRQPAKAAARDEAPF